MSGQNYGQLTLFPVGSHASRSPQPGSEEEQQMTVTSGQKCLELSMSSGPLGSLEKMLLVSSIWHSTRCFLTWKISDTKQGRLYFRLVPSKPRTGGTDVPLWPTPKASDCKGSGPSGSKSAEHDLKKRNLKGVVMYPTPTTGAGLCGGTGNYKQLKNLEESGAITPEERRSMAAGNGGQLNPTWVEALMGFPPGWTELEPDGQTEPGRQKSRE